MSSLRLLILLGLSRLLGLVRAVGIVGTDGTVGTDGADGTVRTVGLGLLGLILFFSSPPHLLAPFLLSPSVEGRTQPENPYRACLTRRMADRHGHF